MIHRAYIYNFIGIMARNKSITINESLIKTNDNLIKFLYFNQLQFSNYSTSFRSVVVITFASHAKGPGFKPQRKQWKFSKFELESDINNSEHILMNIFD